MTTILERDSGSSSAILVVGLLAIVVLAGIAFFALRAYPFNGTVQPGNTLNIDLNDQVPAPDVTYP